MVRVIASSPEAEKVETAGTSVIYVCVALGLIGHKRRSESGIRSKELSAGLAEIDKPLTCYVQKLQMLASFMSVMQPHRVLFIPELLGIILSFVDEDDHVNNACVCKQWSEIALDIIWKEVDGLSRLLTLLRPYKITGRYNVRRPVFFTILLFILFLVRY